MKLGIHVTAVGTPKECSKNWVTYEDSPIMPDKMGIKLSLKM